MHDFFSSKFNCFWSMGKDHFRLEQFFVSLSCHVWNKEISWYFKRLSCTTYSFRLPPDNPHVLPSAHQLKMYQKQKRTNEKNGLVLKLFMNKQKFFLFLQNTGKMTRTICFTIVIELLVLPSKGEYGVSAWMLFWRKTVEKLLRFDKITSLQVFWCYLSYREIKVTCS